MSGAIEFIIRGADVAVIKPTVHDFECGLMRIMVGLTLSGIDEQRYVRLSGRLVALP